MKNFLITGGMGYIGSFTNDIVKQKFGIKPINIDNLSRANKFFAKNFTNNKINISNINKINNIIQKSKIETILHLAAFTCVRESLKKKKLYRKNNFTDQIKFIDIVKKSGVKYFIFASSLSVYEKNKINKKLSPYSYYKIKIEKYLKKISSKNFKVIILRYPNVTGASIDGKLGDANKKISRIFKSIFTSIKNNKKITLFLNIKNKKFPIRNYAHVLDIANLNLMILRATKKQNKSFEIYNIQSKLNLTNYEIAKKITKLLNKKDNFEFKQINKRENLQPVVTLDKKIKKKLKFKFKYSTLSMIIKSNLKWFSKAIN